jgi:hypothetical protein
MSIPTFIFLAAFCLIHKPVPGLWPMVLQKTTAFGFEMLMWAPSNAPFVLSAFFVAYNIILFTIVRVLSPSVTAFGGHVTMQHWYSSLSCDWACLLHFYDAASLLHWGN